MKTTLWTLVLVLVPVLVYGSSEDCSSMTVRLRSFRIVTTACNFTTLGESQLKSVQAPSLILVLPVLQVLVLVLGLPLNLLVLWVLLFRTQRLPSTTLLVNLTVSDLLLLLLALPFRAAYHFSGNNWTLGEPLCRLVMALFYGNMYGSVLCLAFVALDRYVALVHPFSAMTLRSQRTSLIMSATVWLVVLAAMLPLLVMQQTFDLDEPDITTCHDALPQNEQQNYFLPYLAALFSLCFPIPFAVVVFCHVAILRTLLNERKRYSHAICVTVLVLGVFIVCFLPSNVLLLMMFADDMQREGGNLYAPYLLSLAVSASNTVLDPLIYYYISSDFRENAKSALCCRRDRTTTNHSSSSGQRSKVTLLPRSRPTNKTTAV